MKTVEQLKKLSQNPFYVMSEQESEVLEETESIAKRTSSVTKDNKKKESYSRGNATVKETGKLNKHHGDPRAEE